MFPGKEIPRFIPPLIAEVIKYFISNLKFWLEVVASRSEKVSVMGWA
jgi:hypothetical protein